MTSVSERDVAYSMVILWGGSAAQVADGYVGRLAECGDHIAEARWRSIYTLITSMLGAAPDSL